MDKIRQYQQISEVKPEYYRLATPYTKPTIKRIRFNLKETQMYYDNGVYVKGEHARTGGDSDKKECLIFIVDGDL